MAAARGSLCTYQHEHKLIARAEGWAKALQGLALRKFGEQGLASGATALWVDLRDCVHMDSTFLGTLLHLQRAVRCRCQGDFRLVSPSPQCCRVLEQMGLEDVFPTLNTDEPVAPSWQEICCEMEGPESFKCNVIEAHQELARLPGKAGEPFRAVVHGLMEDMEARKRQ